MAKAQDILQDFQVNDCRVCFDIKSWREKAQKQAFQQEDAKVPAVATTLGSIVFSTTETEAPEEYKACPPDALELGRSTWTFLHTLSVYYPDRPSVEQKEDMGQFLRLFSKFYPCSYCASHLREEMKRNPPAVETRSALAQWMCRMHNEVNQRLGKPLFDCAKVDERWKTGPPDGSCG